MFLKTYPLLKSLRKPSLCSLTLTPDINIYLPYPDMPPTCPTMDVERVFKLWEGVVVLSGHRHCKAKSYSYTTETPFDRCLKEQVTCAAAQGTLLSVGHHLQDQEGFLPPPGLLPSSPCLRATLSFPRPSFSSILSPSGAVWRFAALHQLDTHSPGLTLMAFFCTPGAPPNWSWQNTCTLEIQSFFLLIPEPGENEAETPPRFQTANT